MVASRFWEWGNNKGERTAIVNPLLCAKHAVCIGCCGSGMNVYLAQIVIFGAQAMDKSVFIPARWATDKSGTYSPAQEGWCACWPEREILAKNLVRDIGGSSVCATMRLIEPEVNYMNNADFWVNTKWYFKSHQNVPSCFYSSKFLLQYLRETMYRWRMRGEPP